MKEILSSAVLGLGIAANIIATGFLLGVGFYLCKRVTQTKKNEHPQFPKEAAF